MPKEKQRKSCNPVVVIDPIQIIAGRHFAEMPLVAKGIFLELVCHQAVAGTLPSRLVDLARILGLYMDPCQDDPFDRPGLKSAEPMLSWLSPFMSGAQLSHDEDDGDGESSLNSEAILS